MPVEIFYLLIGLFSYYLGINWIKSDSKIKRNIIATMMALLVTGFAYVLPMVIYVASGVVSVLSKDTPEKRAKIVQTVQELLLKNNISDIYIEIEGRNYDEITLESSMFSEEIVNKLTTDTELLSMLKEKGFVHVTFYNDSVHKVSFVYLL